MLEDILSSVIGLILAIFLIFVIEQIRIARKSYKEMKKRIGRAKMFILKKSCGKLRLTWGNEILDILDGKDEILENKEG